MTTARSLSVIASSYLGASVAYDPRIWGERKVARCACRCCSCSRPPMLSTPTRIKSGVDTVHDAPFVRPLLEGARRLYGLRPRVIRLDVGY